MPTPPNDISSFPECHSDCPTDDCKSQILSCLAKMRDEAFGIRDTFLSSTEIKELVKSMKTKVKKIYNSSGDMMDKMREKGGASLKSEDNMLEILRSASDIFYTEDIANKDRIWELLIPLIEKVDNEIDRLSQPTASTKSCPVPAVPADGERDKCSSQYLQDILYNIQWEYTHMAKLKNDDKLTGDDLFRTLEKVVEVIEDLEDKKIELEGHIYMLKDLYVNMTRLSYACEMKEYDQTTKYLERVESIRSEYLTTEISRVEALLWHVDIVAHLDNGKKNQCQEGKKFNIEYEEILHKCSAQFMELKEEQFKELSNAKKIECIEELIMKMENRRTELFDVIVNLKLKTLAIQND